MTKSAQGGVTVVGSINADLMVSVQRHPLPGETLVGSGGDIKAGGKGANQAVAAALQGANVTFVGAVGTDPYAEAALEYLRSSGVDLSNVVEVDATTGLAVITVSADGENTIVVLPGANAAVTAGFIDKHAAAIRGAEIVLLQGEIPAEGFRRAVEIAQAAGTRVVVNLAPVIEVDRSALLTADPLLANEHEAGLILAQLGANVDSQDPHQLVSALLEAGFRSVVLTLGAQGAVVGTSEGLQDIPTPTITAVDTTGAGDAFTGAFVAQLLAGASLVDAARYAARVGAFAALSAGAQPSYPHATDSLPTV
ncbi:MAG: ribokinase [Corynebacterium sp.]|nr:ribokinase [Corynebacterium sp.]